MAFGNATKGYVKKHSGGGGGGGTSNYNDLSNKPSINGVTLSGNKTSEDLNISISVNQITSGDSIAGASALLIVGVDSYNQLFSTIFPITVVTNGAKLISGYDEQRSCEMDVTLNGNILTWSSVGNVPIHSVYII